jgi:hypothetical protein
VSWYLVPKGAVLTSAKRKPRPVLVATGRASFAAAGTGKLKVTLTAAGKRHLKAAKTLKLTAKGAFIPTTGTTVTTKKTFRLRR